MHPEEIWHGKSPVSILTRTALLPLSALYATGWAAYRALYRFGFKKAYRPNIPVVCVGNLTTGGTGKTPVVAHLAEVLTALGHQVVVGCSGYGSPAAEAAQIAPSGPLDPKQWGDEPALLRELLPETPLVVGRRRVLAAQLVEEAFPVSVLLMDDGFQHLPLAKSISILLDPGTSNRFCLPAGPYREPWGNRRLADLVLPGAFRVETALHLEIPEAEIQVLTAIGSPQRFEDDLLTIGKQIRTRKWLPDHDPLDAPDLLSAFDPTLPIVVTAKDWVKMKSHPNRAAYRIEVAHQTARIVPETEFRDWLEAKLNERRP